MQIRLAEILVSARDLEKSADLKQVIPAQAGIQFEINCFLNQLFSFANAPRAAEIVSSITAS
ncbi:MAG: hypothetical protein RL564_604, partial [Pseudomonadota bacterium]